LWGASEPKEITLTDRSVTINMAHLFSQLKLNISSENVDRDIQGILDVTVEGRKQVDLALNTGEITPGEDLGPLETPIIDPAVHSKTKVSDYHVFYPSPTKVTIGTLMITNRLFHNLEATFTKTLKPGKSYILAVDLILVGWAYSNIYLVSTGTNTGYLTFDKYPKETSLENTKGVLFRGGSLIGIEGSRNTSGQNSTYALIIPDKNPGSGVWDLTKLSSTVHDLWPRAGKSFHNIPFWYQNVLGGDGTYYTNPDFENYKGDICSYITNGSWRLPTKAEFNNGSYGAFGATLNGSGTKGVKFTTDRTVFFPAAGYVTVGSGEDGGGKGIGDGAIGVYWSGNVVDNLIETYGLYFSSDGVAHGTALHNMYAGSVRCIKD
jgi:hypothetical protein